MMATSGLVSRIHSCDFSKPENTRFQYGSSVLPLSMAAPMAGTCDEPIPAMILATASLPFCFGFRFGLTDRLAGFGSRLGLCGRLGFDFGLGGGFLRRRAGQEVGWRILAGARAVA